MKLLEPLEWDTGFFGFPVARIMNSEVTCDELRFAVAEIQERRIKLAYWAADDPDTEVQKRAIDLGGLLVDTKLTFLAEIDGSTEATLPALSLVEPYRDEMPLDELKQLAVDASVYSRFMSDPRFPQDKARALFEEWILRSVDKAVADEVLVIRQGTHVVGMLTIGGKKGFASIGLLAVAASFRGRQFGEALVRAALSWSHEQGLNEIRVVTQQANSSACHLYQKCGFKLEKTEFVYHFWT